MRHGISFFVTDTRAYVVNVSQEAIETLKGVSSNSLAGLMISLQGLRSRTISGARPLGTRGKMTSRIVGPAFTLRNVPVREDLTWRASIVSKSNPLNGTIDRIPPGSVLVVDMMGDKSCGGLGDVMVAALAKRGVAALVTDGPMRDGGEIEAMGFPVFCDGIHPAPSNRSLLAAGVQEVIGCGGVMVEPGDIVVADADGVVVVPVHMADELARKGLELEEIEGWIKTKIGAGGKASEFYPPSDKIAEMFRQETKAGQAE